MTIPSTATIANLAREAVLKGIVPGGFRDQFIRKIRFQLISQPGESVDYNRATSAPTVPVYGPGDALTLSTTATTKVTSNFRRIGDVAEVDHSQLTAASDPNDQLEVQVAMKRAGIVRRLGVQVLTGDSLNPNDLEGFFTRITSGQSVTSATLTKEQVLKLVALVTASDGHVGAGADCLVGHDRVVRYLVKLFEDAPGGGGLEWRTDSDLGVPVPHVAGTPVYVGQEPIVSNLSNLWAAKLRGPTGCYLLHTGGTSTDFGIEVREVPMQAAISKRGFFVGGFYALVVPEAESIARISGINHVTGIPSSVPA